MRLDGLGKPPLLQNDGFGKTEVVKIKTGEISEITPSEGSESATSQTSDDRSRLGKILSILEKTKERKKDRKPKKETGGIQIYQSVANGGTKLTKGQALDVRV